MDYHKFEVQDFLADEHFTSWVLKPDAEHEDFWTTWIRLHPDRREVVQQARHILENIDFSETWTKTERSDMWNYIQTGTSKSGIPSGRKIQRWLRMPYAAVFALLLCAGGWFYLTSRPVRFQTPYGKQRSVTLADGSRITLNANSELTVRQDFENGAKREVWIRGEAFFDVAKMTRDGKKIPFIVHTDQLDIHVLGTAFNITNRRGRVDVALEHGSVKLVDAHNAANTILLEPGEKATQTITDALLKKEIVDVKEYSGWRRKVFQYKGKKLRELAEMIGDSYGIEVIIENEALKEETFTGSFPTDSVETFFEKLGKLYPLEIAKNGDKYYLR
ncbi:FecR family protein [Dyadobacter sp. CY323]|uniref:FecR family protein n=1 Tax=Dyadobacter sp. CY323 TaxID=2907302 RepID=UPI001F441DAA|nr:FecR domain-containing protein [Dyadobacter sp. CY323]MCE6991084.1 FecR domain-containing protein [Dyadobacter sp. CY323]